MIAQMWHRLRLIVAQGVGRVISHDRVQATVLDSETLANLHRVEPYGLSYRPKPGCETYLLFPAGDRSGGFAIVCGDKRYQLQLTEGEVALHDDQGQKVHLKRNKILIETPLDFEVRAANIKLHATTSYKFDVNGQGQKWDGNGVETWQDNDAAKPHHNHAPPEI